MNTKTAAPRFRVATCAGLQAMEVQHKACSHQNGDTMYKTLKIHSETTLLREVASQADFIPGRSIVKGTTNQKYASKLTSFKMEMGVGGESRRGKCMLP